MREQREWLYPVALVTLAVVGVLAHDEVFLSASRLLPRDNFHAHYPLFEYVSVYLEKMGEFPTWDYSAELGMWLAPWQNNFLLLLPHRFMGYALVAGAGVDPALAYKLALLLGLGAFLVGVYCLAKRLFASSSCAAFSVACSLLSGISIGVLHQEQVLGTLFYIPFLWLALLSGRIVLAGALFGLALNSHYPHLLILYVSSTWLWSFTIRGRHAIVPAKRALLAAVACAVSAAPALHTYLRFEDRLISPYRGQTGEIAAPTFDDYLELNDRDYSSVSPAIFKYYLGVTRGTEGGIGVLDENALFLGYGVLLVVAALFAVKVPHRAFHLGMIGTLGVLAMGTYSPLPRLLWHIPGMAIFRQWYHFVPLLNLHLLFVVVLVGRRILWKKIFFGIWLLTNLPWALYALQKVERRLVPNRSAHPALFARRHLNLALPKGIELGRVGELARRAEFHWQTGKGAVIPAEDGDLAVTPLAGGLELRILRTPPGTESLVWSQYDDGHWMIDGRGHRPAGQSNLLVLPVTNRSGPYFISRDRDAWAWLIAAMWLPLAGCLVLPGARRLVKLRFLDRCGRHCVYGGR